MRDHHLLLRGLPFHIGEAGNGPALLLLHGFTGSAASWEQVRPALASRYRVIAPDLIGHGSSAVPEDASRYSIEQAVADLLDLLDLLAIRQCDLLGYSLGGRLALSLALAAPERIRRLVLESASPGLADPTERAARIAADEALAERIERDGLAAFVAEWEALPLWRSQASLPAEVHERLHTQRLQNHPHGLANSLRGMGTGQMVPLWDRLADLRRPTLLLAGTLDPKFVTIAQQMAARLPDATLQLIPDAGHTIHLEQPARFLDTTLTFLQSR